MQGFSSFLKMEAVGSSEILVMIYQTACCHTTEDSNLTAVGTSNFTCFVGFDVLTALVMKSSIFWDMACSLLKVNHHFRETCRFHLQG
jgi:hypothetical protein